MSPSMKSKSKSKTSKDQRKATPKTYGATNHGSSIPANAYNPVSGTFHTLETTSVATSTPTHDNSRFRNMDDTDEHTISLQGMLSEYDSVSNSGSCSGESEDPKEKVTNSCIQQDIVPGSGNDRREKIRLKNERKHQRQRERRAQELHDRCSGYLMSRKLEALAQQLVAMGFSSEQATLALMLNDGKLEESVSWLFEANEAHTNGTTNLEIGGNLKIDINEELAQISDMEVRYSCSKQEVERLVVACEGDLQKVENTLKSQKQESQVTQSKPEDYAQIHGLMRSQGLPSASVSMQQRGIEGDFNYSKFGGSAFIYPDSQSMNLQSLHLNHPIAPGDKRWGVPGSSPCAMNTMASSTQVLFPSVKMEVQPSAIRKEGRMIHQGTEMEPVVMMQHSQFTNGEQDPFSSVNALPSGRAGFYENSVAAVENIRSNGKLIQNHDIGNVASEHLEQFYQAHYKEHPYVFRPVDSSSNGVRGFTKQIGASPLSTSIHRSSCMNASSHSLTVPPSLGLFSGQSAARTFNSHSHVDWNTRGLVPEFDYTNVDWTLDCPSSSKSGDLWLGILSLLRNNSRNRMGSPSMAGLQNVGMSRDTSSSTGLREWTSPFEGKDIFSLPRQFVTSPFL